MAIINGLLKMVDDSYKKWGKEVIQFFKDIKKRKICLKLTYLAKF